MHNPYSSIEAEVLNIVTETANIKTFTLKPNGDIGFRAGQFMEVSLPGIGEAPFTPSSSHNNKDTIDFTIMSAGRITKLIHEAKRGDIFGLRGPYGLGYPLDIFKSKEVIEFGRFYGYIFSLINRI